MKIANGRVILAVCACGAVALSFAVPEAGGQARLLQGEYAPTWSTNVMEVGSGDRDFTGKFTGPDHLPYTGDDTDISGESFPSSANAPFNSASLPGNSGYGSMGIAYPAPYDTYTPPPPGGSLSGLTIEATGTPATAEFDLNTPFGAQPPYVYHGYTTFTGLFGDDHWTWSNVGRLWDGRIGQWEHITVCYLTGIDTSLFNIDPSIHTDVASPATEFSLEEWVSGTWEMTLEPNEEEECNTGVYNNNGANQHGRGHPRYYFEVTNVDPLNDDHRRHEYTVQHFSGTQDLPASEDHFAQSDRDNPNTTDAIINDTWVKGILLPVDALRVPGSSLLRTLGFRNPHGQL